ncbi:hypothetical protein B0H16DRAFT_1775940, partial [Mycena metata]
HVLGADRARYDGCTAALITPFAPPRALCSLFRTHPPFYQPAVNGFYIICYSFLHTCFVRVHPLFTGHNRHRGGRICSMGSGYRGSDLVWAHATWVAGSEGILAVTPVPNSGGASSGTTSVVFQTVGCDFNKHPPIKSYWLAFCSNREPRLLQLTYLPTAESFFTFGSLKAGETPNQLAAGRSSPATEYHSGARDGLFGAITIFGAARARTAASVRRSC